VYPAAPARTAFVAPRFNCANPAAGRYGDKLILKPLFWEETMKIPLVALAGLAIGFALPTFAQHKDTVDPEVAQQIRVLAKKYDEAFSKNDAAALVALFTEDAVQVAPEGVFYGRQAIEKRYADNVFQQWHCNNHVQQIGQVIAIGNEVVWVGEWSASCGGNQVHGYISNVAVREGDAWKVRVGTFNVTPPPPPAETK
jgi:uncharacterized protein (TIGR02246 family)